MAVIQISQIQVRRGLLDELGQLGSGEFGWAVDKLRLFIGNGTVTEGAPYEGNTELLTQHTDILALLANYQYRGVLGGYEVLTGSSYIAPSKRRFQDKIDDFVSVLDFGAKGDGISDDTVPIQRAIDQLYGRLNSYIPIATRRTLGFHPGRYRISAELRIPPYCVFKNSGKDSVIIEQTNANANCIIKTTTSSGFSAENIDHGLDLASQLGPIEVSGITFKTLVAGKPVAIIDSAKDVNFYRCRFEGSDTQLTTLSNSCSVRITSLASNTKSVYFEECDFSRSSVAAKIDSLNGVSDIAFDKCTFVDLHQGVTVKSADSQVASIKITNSVFDRIAKQGLVTDGNTHGVTSSFNTYLNVGNDLGVDPQSHVIEFGGNLSYSIADIFVRSMDHDLTKMTVKSNTGSTISTNITSQMQFGNTYQTVGRSVIVNNNSVNYIPISTRFKSGIIDYSIERNNTVRSGTLKFSLTKDLSAFDYHDSYTETSPTGVDLSVEYNPLPSDNPKPYIICIADTSGYPSLVTYDIKSLF